MRTCGVTFQKLGCILLLCLSMQIATPAEPLNFYIDYSLIPDEAAMRAHDLSIVSPQARFDMTRVHKTGQEIYAYISVVEVASDAPYRPKLEPSGIRLMGTNELWKSDFADIAAPEWTRFVLKELAAPIVEQGFDGFFLDTVDSHELLAKGFPDRAEEFRKGIISLIKALKSAHPTKKIILNRGFPIWEELKESIDGVLVESVFQTFEGLGGKYKPVTNSDSDWLIGHIRRIQAANLPVYVVDYSDPSRADLAMATAKRIQDLGCHAFVTTPQLKGVTLAPIHEKPRRLLVLFGNQDTEAVRVEWATDSELKTTSQSPLEWLGFEMDFLNLSRDPLPETLGGKYLGVVIDRSLRIPVEQELKTVDWLIAQKDAGKKILFLSQFPTLEPATQAKLFRAFGIGGTGDSIFPVTQLTSPIISPMMNFEAKVNLLPTRYRDVQAPAGSKVHLSVRGIDGRGANRTFDAVFTTPWGGAAIEPYIFFSRPDTVPFWLLNPFDFFTEALISEPFPVPDTTTRDGQRVFYAHIDGDGFRHQTTLEKGKTSAEIILEQVVQKYPLPFTCSVIESEIRGLITDQKPGDEARMTAIAREMFALDNVQAASHAFTHPFYWNDTDRESALYEKPFLDLIPPFTMKEIDVEREVVGSVKFIQERLLPPGKQVEIFLWSGNCRPFPEAIRLTRELGIENMNGGDTTLSRRNPTLTQVSPRAIPWGDELQIHAANQNENVYRDRWKPYGQSDIPFYGGYIHAIESFQQTGSPRRLKPVNVYFHFYSGDSLMALKALTKALDWSVEQPLHSLTARQYAQTVRDCRNTRLFRAPDKRWILVNDGNLRTFRIDRPTGLPDISQCEGVTGYAVSGEHLYIHTDGSPRVTLRFSYQPSAHIYLISSSAEIEFTKLAPESAVFSVSDLRPCRVTLGGAFAGAQYEVRINEQPTTLRADSKGHLALTLPNTARVALKSLNR
jgi:polysaccharide biosynthesis protein PelA